MSLAFSTRPHTNTSASVIPTAASSPALSRLDELSLLDLPQELTPLPAKTDSQAATLTDQTVFKESVQKKTQLADWVGAQGLKNFQSVFDARKVLSQPKLSLREVFPASEGLTPAVKTVSLATFLGASLLVGVDSALFSIEPKMYAGFNVLKIASIFYITTSDFYSSSNLNKAVGNFAAAALALAVPPLLLFNHAPAETLLALPALFGAIYLGNIMPGFSVAAIRDYFSQRGRYINELSNLEALENLYQEAASAKTKPAEDPNTFLKNMLAVLDAESQNLEREIARYEKLHSEQEADFQTLQNSPDKQSSRIQSLIVLAQTNLSELETRIQNLRTGGLARITEARETVFPEIVAETYALMQSLGKPVAEENRIVFVSTISQVESRTKERHFALKLSDGDVEEQGKLAEEILTKSQKILDDIRILRKSREELRTL